MILAPHAYGLIAKAPVFVPVQETLGPGTYSFTPAARQPGASQVRIRVLGGGGWYGNGSPPSRSGGGGGGGLADRTVVFAPGDTAVTMNLFVGAVPSSYLAGVASTVTAAFNTAINMTGNGGNHGSSNIRGTGGSASGGTTNTPGDDGEDATLDSPDWFAGVGGAPNGGYQVSGPPGAGYIILDWS